jgi:hypothetical protein
MKTPRFASLWGRLLAVFAGLGIAATVGTAQASVPDARATLNERVAAVREALRAEAPGATEEPRRLAQMPWMNWGNWNNWNKWNNWPNGWMNWGNWPNR